MSWMLYTDFGLSLRKEIAHLNFEGLELLVAKNAEEKDCNTSAPVFVFVCQEEANWKRTCARLHLDTSRTWTERDVKDSLRNYDEEGRKTNFSSNPDLLSKLHKVLIEKIFEKMILHLVEFRYDVNERDLQGWTALHHSIKNKLIDTTKMLINAGADVTAEARISSWIPRKVPALFHCLYHLDVEAARIVIRASKQFPVTYITSINDFMFLPANVPVEIQQCLSGVQEINLLTFLLLVFIIRAYRDHSLSSGDIKGLLNQAVNLRQLLEDMQFTCFSPPDFLTCFHCGCQASLAARGFCKGKFVFQIARILFRFD